MNCYHPACKVSTWWDDVIANKNSTIFNSFHEHYDADPNRNTPATPCMTFSTGWIANETARNKLNVTCYALYG